ncbi:SIS domain-containing protein [Phytoactinopolyspora alkaliphila]|uniref:SIS domain-containing protein n=1 Tax=Phytoactinopolyspora alkaliphila TaxID=1783498 RepID=A0A6N9YIY8_9ACTN|nr:SIS domain-containing protein [Phytoactinopolyspora alkaliphila]NED94922.1 SIS domain-containing protein [Phytoactinopolyspora alkaliphila]
MNDEPAARRYLDGAIEILRRIADDESEAITAAGDRIAESITDGARLFALGCGHSALAVQELVYRAGGLMLVNPLLAPGADGVTVRPVTLSSDLEKMPGYGPTVVDSSPLRRGDVLIVVSLSGRNAMPVQAAQRARQIGATVVAVTSSAYEDLPARDEVGERLVDASDIVLDTNVPLGDAILTTDGVPQPYAPASGIATGAVLQSLVTAVIDGMLARGVTPPVFLSANLDGGSEWNAALLKEHRERIFYMN